MGVISGLRIDSGRTHDINKVMTSASFRKLFLALCSQVAALNAGAALAAGASTEHRITLMHEQRQRSALVYVPSNYDASVPAPLLLVFHGGGGNADGAQRMAQLTPLADKHRFIVVYPNGSGVLRDRLLTWNTWNCCGYALTQQVDDVGFVRDLIALLKGRYPIDSSRIFATGISNGGMMAHKLGCELSEQIAAIAPIAGALNTDACAPGEPVSVVIFHGTDDQYVLFQGGKNTKRFPGADPRVDKSVAHAFSTWSTLNKCSLSNPSQQGSVRRTVCSNGTRGAEVVLFAIEGQGHSWPGGRPGLRNGNVDPPSQEISASEVMIDFFMRHPKR